MAKTVEPLPVVRAATIKPRNRGFVYRPVVSWSHNSLVTETGEVREGADAIEHLRESGGALVVTRDVGALVELLSTYGDRHTTYALAMRLSDAAPEDKDEPWISKARLVGFGWRHRNTERTHKRQCVILDASRFLTSPGASATLAADDHAELLRFAFDVRAWCKEHDLPIRTTAGGLAAALMRDKRFIGSEYWRVPRATNERVRPHLPGVHMQAVAPRGSHFRSAYSLDQRRAYHRAAQTVAIPHPRDLYARGFFSSHESNLADLWLEKTDPEFSELMREHGLFIVRAVCGIKPHRFAPPAVHKAYAGGPLGTAVAIWSSELESCLEHGMTIDGAYCAWTTATADKAFPKYGRWAESQIDSASPERARWLKPALHARYGLAGSRQRRLLLANSRSTKDEREPWLVAGREIRVAVTELPASAPPMTHVVALGVLQSAIRARSLDLAWRLEREGVNVMHVHADGMHVEDAQIPLLGPDWSIERVTNLRYEDDVSWTSDQRDVLPGRDLRLRVDRRRAIARAPMSVEK